RAGDDARQRQRPQHAPEHGPRSRTEAECRLLEIARNALEHALQRQDHVGQVDGDDADDHGPLGEHDLQRPSIAPRLMSPALSAPLEPNSVIQPAARTALPTNSGSTTSITRTFL